jgi:WD repeat-containing protein 19
MFKQVIPLIKKIKSPKLLIQLAKAKESEQNYGEAEQAFEQAEDWENVIRLNINNLNDIAKAKWVLRNRCQTEVCASMISSYCVKKGEHKEAIEFLLLANKKEEAFLLA